MTIVIYSVNRKLTIVTYMPAAHRREKIHAAVIRLLREERERQGVSMYQLAPKAGLSQSALSLIDRGLRMPALDTLLRITEVLEVKLGDILLRAEAESGAKAESKAPKKTPKKQG